MIKKDPTREHIKKIAEQFATGGEFVRFERYGEGHINDTYAVYVKTRDESTKRFILQCINNMLFKDVDRLMNNIKLVTEFGRSKVIERGGDPDRESLSIIYTKDGQPFYEDKQIKEFYRAYIFIENATTYQVVEKKEHFYQAAVAFAKFQKMLAEFDASQLHESIPNFHNTRMRFENFKKALAENKSGRAKDIQDEINFVLEREKYSDVFVDMLKSGEMPLKVTHNDTKLNNVMIDDNTGVGLAVIDLDTVMPGCLGYDFGDSIRFGCNPVAEDEKDLSKVVFSKELFKSFAEGYLTTLKGTISDVEKKYLAFSAILMTYECGMRFLTDHLDGDVYFRIKREGHNLDRARTQFKLVKDMEACLDELNEIVYSI